MGWLTPLSHALASLKGVVFDGIAGDILSTALFQRRPLHELYVQGRLKDTARGLMNDWRSCFAGLRDLLKPEMKEALSLRRVEDRLVEELSRHAGSPNPLRDFFFWNRTRREIALAPFSLFRANDVKTPYLDMEVVEFLLSLSYEAVADRNLHTETIARAYTRYAAVPYESPNVERRMRLPEVWWLGVQCFAALHCPTLRAHMNVARVLKRFGAFAGGRPWWSVTGLLYWSELLKFSQSGHTVRRISPFNGAGQEVG
jgi:hypothetical protein